ncbi:MAG: hypothetical protein U9Q38_08960 [Thermodesulfobacteriota bacterium]|nr:hypothetical protein [Thermodesulfobacteriota bacterium]
MIFKENVKTSRQLVAKTETQKFFDMFLNKTPNSDIILRIEEEFNCDFQNIKLDILKFVNWWLEK